MVSLYITIFHHIYILLYYISLYIITIMSCRYHPVHGASDLFLRGHGARSPDTAAEQQNQRFQSVGSEPGAMAWSLGNLGKPAMAPWRPGLVNVTKNY